jgi:hypothetical protein
MAQNYFLALSTSFPTETSFQKYQTFITLSWIVLSLRTVVRAVEDYLSFTMCVTSSLIRHTSSAVVQICRLLSLHCFFVYNLPSLRSRRR